MTVSSDFQSLCNVIATKKDCVIGVCGMPGAGKTTLAKKLKDIFADRAILLHTDHFITVPTLTRKSFLATALADNDLDRLRYLAQPADPKDNPHADTRTWYDWTAMAETIDKLRGGEAVERNNCWDQKTSLCDLSTTYRLAGKPAEALYFVDGIYLDEPPLNAKFGYRIMIDENYATTAQRRRARDSHRIEEIYAQYKDMVSDIYCRPYLETRRGQMDFIIGSSR